MKHFPLFAKKIRLKKMFLQVTLFHVTFPEKYVISSAKISDDLFLVIDSKFRNLTQILHFPLKTSPTLSCTKIINIFPQQTSPNLSLKCIFSLKCLPKFLPPKMAKKLFSPKMAMMRSSASFPHGMMGWNS